MKTSQCPHLVDGGILLGLAVFVLSGCAGKSSSNGTPHSSAPSTAPSIPAAQEPTPTPVHAAVSASTQEVVSGEFTFSLGISEAVLTTDSHPHFELHVTRSGAPAEVTVTAVVRPRGKATGRQALAVESEGKGAYDMHPDIHTAGDYDLVLTYRSPDQKSAEVVFPFSVGQGTGKADEH